jgi:hypothetical protein
MLGAYFAKMLRTQIVSAAEQNQMKHLGIASLRESQYGRFPDSHSLLYSNGLLPKTNIIIDTKNQAVPMIPRSIRNEPP